MKRILTFSIAIFVLFSGFSVYANYARLDLIAEYEYLEIPEFVPVFTPEFSAEINEITIEHSRGNYFSSIIMTIDDNRAVIDGREIIMDAAPEIIDGEIILPIEEMAKIIGDEEFISNNMIAGRSNRMSLREMDDTLLRTLNLNDGRILIIRPYQTRQVLLQMYIEYELTETYGAIAIANNGNGFYFLQYETEIDTRLAIQLLNENPNVRYAESNGVVTLPTPALNIIVDTDEETDENLIAPANSNIGAVYRPAFRELDGRRAWGSNRIGSDDFIRFLDSRGRLTPSNRVYVAVLDTGINRNHNFFHIYRPQNRIHHIGTSFDDNHQLTDGAPGSNGHSHGTHVAGTVVDNTPENVGIISVRVIGNHGATPTGTHATVAMGIDSAISFRGGLHNLNVRVINMSLGGFAGFGCINTMQEAVYRATAQGITVVAGAGNDRINIDEPNLGDGGEWLQFIPATLYDVITVAASSNMQRFIGGSLDDPWKQNEIDPDDGSVLRIGTNFGDSPNFWWSRVDVSAPGENILSTTATAGTWSWNNRFNFLIPTPTMTGLTEIWAGTSMAAPHVSAAVAMIKLDNPGITPQQARRIIRASVDVPNGWNTFCNSRISDPANRIPGVGYLDMHFGTGVLNLRRYIEFAPEIIVNTPHLSFDGEYFHLGTVEFTKRAMHFERVNVLLFIDIYTPSGVIMGDPIHESMSRSSTPILNTSISFRPDEYVVVYMFTQLPNGTFGNLVRTVIRPSAFTF
ncbi:MAG: S8 family serine peptidase [Oscillospiraceae bacterium]|nr:S8 family serine peptidase [Oscillospiraceae bacterium]